MDTVLYSDEAMEQQVAIYPWYRASKPNRRSHQVMHNCFRYVLIWHDPLVFATKEALQQHRNFMIPFTRGLKALRVTDFHGQSALLALA